MCKLNSIAYIPAVRTMLKKMMRDCVTCRKKFSRPMQQQMGPLPDHRSQCTADRRPAFDTTMLDLAGPFHCTLRRRKSKRWILVLTCAQFRAIHLEMVTGLDSLSFMRAFNRFLARRPRPSQIISDNGTNFRGMDAELQQFWKSDQFQKIKSQFPEIKWKFNTPSAPHQGGAFERMVQSTKKALKTVLPSPFHESSNISDDEFNTALAMVESIINSRPLGYVDQDDVLEPLTPSHFLCSSASREIAPTFDPTSPVMKKWENLSETLDNYWKRFISELMPKLHQSQKWVKTQRNIKVGDVVQVLDKEVRGRYALGKVTECFTNKKDGLVRVVMVKTAESEYQRPITKLSLVLPMEEEEEDH